MTTVITGFGAISPLGLTVDQLWQNICQGESGIDTIQAFDPVGFDCKIGGEVDDFKIQKHIPKTFRKSVKLMSRDIKLAIIAAEETINSSGLITKAIAPDNINVDPRRFAINLGAGLISCDLEELSPSVSASLTDGKFDIKKYGEHGLPLVTPLWLLKYLPNMLACHVGIIHDIQGPSNTITCAETSGHLAIIEASGVLSRGSADVALAGAAEAKINPIVLIRQCLIKRVTTCGNSEPEKACRPFDISASGSVFGEAAAMVLLETETHAKNRSAKIYCEIAGFGQSNNLSTDYTRLESDGKGLQIAIETALTQAGISADDIDLIIPHGTAIAKDDRAESTAIFAALGDKARGIAVFPTKSFLSNTGAASSALDIVVAVKAMETGIIPAAINFDSPADGCCLNINTKLQKKQIRHTLCCSYTYGGQTSAIVLRKCR